METQLTFADTAVALSLDYECVFFVDVENDNYAMYAFHGNHQSLKLSETSDFWADTRVNLQTVVYKDDQKSFGETVSKDYLLSALKKEDSLTYKYRILADGKPVWYSMKVVLGKSKDRDYLIIGVSNIDKQERDAAKSKTYAQIVMTLAERYDALYLVDLETDHFVQYKAERVYTELSVAQEGDKFFEQLQEDAKKVVYEEDIPLIQAALDRKTLLQEIDEAGSFSLTYRLNTPKGPLYVNLMAVYSDKTHLIISISDVDIHVRREQDLKNKLSKNAIYNQIVMALAERYDALYMVDLETNKYAQYKAERMYSELSVAQEGEDFFNQLQKDALSVVYKDDVPLIQEAFKRDVLLKVLDDAGVFTLAYRLNSSSGPIYVKMVAVYSDKTHIVISVTNVDAQMRREQKIREDAAIAFEKARRDDLTGIKNKNAYGEFERSLNAQIEAGKCSEFAIAICDVNGLKTVNDTRGHKAGDDYIRSASRLVCETFKHSPVFRVGGDEFVAILRGSDFDGREDLEKKFVEIVKHNAEENKVVVACGISVFDKDHDKSVSAVFERADALMYRNKMSLKGGRDEIINTIIRTIGARTTI